MWYTTSAQCMILRFFDILERNIITYFFSPHNTLFFPKAILLQCSRQPIEVTDLLNIKKTATMGEEGTFNFTWLHTHCRTDGPRDSDFPTCQMRSFPPQIRSKCTVEKCSSWVNPSWCWTNVNIPHGQWWIPSTETDHLDSLHCWEKGSKATEAGRCSEYWHNNRVRQVRYCTEWTKQKKTTLNNVVSWRGTPRGKKEEKKGKGWKQCRILSVEMVWGSRN